MLHTIRRAVLGTQLLLCSFSSVAAFACSFWVGSPVAWSQCDINASKVQTPDGAFGDEFGKSVAVSGNVAVIGAYKDDDNGSNSGSAYVFRFNGASWEPEAKLLPSDGAPDDLFGISVSLSGNVAVIGSPYDDDNGTSSGSAYVFRFNGSSWVQEQKLLASDGAASDGFGAVSVSGNVILIGAFGDDDNGTNSGSAYVFRFNGSSWVQEQKLLASDASPSSLFGTSVSISGDVALVGAYGHNDNGPLSGSAYVFRFNGTGWSQEAKLLPSDGAADDWFGRSVAVSGDVAVIGAKLNDDNGTNSGSAYVIGFNGTGWIEEAKLLASDGAAGDEFGVSVAVDGDVAVIGASKADNGSFTDSGSAYRFGFNGSMWIEQAKFVAPDVFNWDQCGNSVAVLGDLAVVGCVLDDTSNGTNSGSVYTIESPCGFDHCPADLDGNSVVDAADLASLLVGWGPNPGHAADLNGDGLVDSSDLATLLSDWGACS